MAKLCRTCQYCLQWSGKSLQWCGKPFKIVFSCWYSSSNAAYFQSLAVVYSLNYHSSGVFKFSQWMVLGCDPHLAQLKCLGSSIGCRDEVSGVPLDLPLHHTAVKL